MKRIFFAAALSLVLMVSVSGCGSGSGESGFGDGASVSDIDGYKGRIKIRTLSLAWDAPLNSDGTPMTNVVGYKVHYGTSSGVYDKTVDNGMNKTCMLTDLSRGMYYVAVTCYDANGIESSFSNEIVQYIR
jgi:hypothetical protein